MPSNDTPKTVILSGPAGIGICQEALATVAILPGMLLARSSATGVKPHDVDSGIANLHFAVEDGAQGRTIEDQYAIGEVVHFKTLVPGTKVYGLLAAGSAAIVVGDKLVSDGDGTLKKLVAATGGTVVAEALEAVNNSGGGTRARIRVEIMPAAYIANQET